MKISNSKESLQVDGREYPVVFVRSEQCLRGPREVDDFDSGTRLGIRRGGETGPLRGRPRGSIKFIHQTFQGTDGIVLSPEFRKPVSGLD